MDGEAREGAAQKEPTRHSGKGCSKLLPFPRIAASIPPQTNISASPSQRDFSLHEAMGVAPPSRQAPRLGSAGTQRRVVEDKERGRLQSHVLRELLESRNEVAQAGQSFDAQAAASR